MGTKHQRNSARNQREEQHTTNEQPSAKPARACRNRLLRARNPRNILETGTIVPNPPTVQTVLSNRNTEKAPMSQAPLSLGEQAREQRRAMRLTQADVAALSMVSERFIREFEQGKRSVRLDKVEAVLAVLGLDVVAVQHVPEALR
ncbi:helix-turn-helix domain-containing protein [Corynebacterium diphtheriae]|uniref:helix-turn-helix domain-containing protein n=2 Tax=Corynebacterium diphtheriae TaxID=1717 RepID=UPI001FD25903|nr:helix-turn-helix domain-containing protein [Corynebacterium diphtheriae]